ncbi:MAG: transcription-repair coupling factor, partial [Clostridia bacterium]|nr:transcription-repair coupling factor [Clostridia bacterium]
MEKGKYVNNVSDFLVGMIRRETEYKQMLETLYRFSAGGKAYTQGPALVTGVSDGARNAIISSLVLEKKLSEGKTAVVLVPDEKTAYSLKNKLSAFIDGVSVFPARDFNFYNVEASSKEWEYERLKVLREICSGACKVVAAVPEAALSILPPKEYLNEKTHIKVGNSVDLYKFSETLENYGYTKTDTVEGAGQYSKRGDILDIFVPDKENPVRLEFFGDELDGAGYFDVMTQRRTESITEIDITPVKEIKISKEKREEVLKINKALCNSAIKKQNDKLASRLAQERTDIENGDCKSLDKYLPYIYGFTTLFDYAKGTLFVCDYPRVRDRLNAYISGLNQTLVDMASLGEMNIKNCVWCKNYEDLKTVFLKRPCVATDIFASTPDFEISGLFAFDSKQSPGIERGTDVLCDDLEGYIRQGYKTALCVKTASYASELFDMLNSKGIKSVLSENPDISEMSRKHVYIIPQKSASDEYTGFEFTKSKTVFLCEENVSQGYALRKGKTERAKDEKSQKNKNKITSYLELTSGNYVVHELHGIGQYVGIKTLTVAGVTRDYITIKYAGKDVLYVPCDQLDKVSRYTGKAENVTLSKMGGSEWIKKKQRAKKAAKNMAKELITLYAERMRRPGYAFSEDTEWQREFESNFEYEETEGQLDAVNDIKRDMEKSHPMDRLLCGDVGFGKTEVALRAAFKCIMDGKQVAFLVPTTVLALQHFRTVSSRMHGFPIKVEMLSRYVSAKKAKDVLERLKTGKVDIVVGTHKLLNKKIEFKDLGLLIVDEEQRFGVAHKERLKEMSKQVDVLTLTATPIPRTFNMALVGIRDMSILEEAPIDRYPVQTYVLEYDKTIVYEAVRKELRRGGQVFYMHNRVEDIENTAYRLKTEFPEARIETVHGQMDKERLSEIWYDMTEGKIDILVGTTRRETGVDVPNANTLIIEDADKMGLSQLHQIRGRVGRSNRRAYAYFTWRPENMFSEIAQKRLVAIKEFTEFGSGFKIAMKDLEIRGAGNLLGAEQSGHMEEVGYDMFIKILEQAVLEEKGKQVKESPKTSIDLGISAYIPEKYISAPQRRIEMYKRI